VQVVMVLKKEIMRTQSADAERGPEYRQMLVAAIHSCAVKFPEVASSVVHLLMDFLGDPLVSAQVFLGGRGKQQCRLGDAYTGEAVREGGGGGGVE
jgi:hypothetical protein